MLIFDQKYSSKVSILINQRRVTLDLKQVFL